MLVLAVLYHWQIEIVDYRNISQAYDLKDKIDINPCMALPIFSTKEPFRASNNRDQPLLKILPYSRVYEYRCLEIRKLSMKYLEYKVQRDYDLALKSLRFKSIISN